MSDSDGPKLTKAQQLELNGYVAPVLRNASEKAMSRRVKFFDQSKAVESWDEAVTKHGTHAEALKGLAKIHELEHAVQEGVRPKEIVCENCGKTVKVPAHGKIPTVCRPGTCQAQRLCAGWGKTEGSCKAVPGQKALSPDTIRYRKGEPWRCRACARNKLYASPEYAAKHTAAMRERSTSAEWRKNQKKGAQKRTENPEWKAKFVQRMRETWADPQKRQEMASSMRGAKSRKAEAENQTEKEEKDDNAA